jgi:hypothetical protein
VLQSALCFAARQPSAERKDFYFVLIAALKRRSSTGKACMSTIRMAAM